MLVCKLEVLLELMPAVLRKVKLCNTAAECYGLHLECYKYSFLLTAYERGDCIKASLVFLAGCMTGCPLRRASLFHPPWLAYEENQGN